jgi:CRISPR-associated protein Cmr3
MDEQPPRVSDLPHGHVWIGLWIEPLDLLFFRDGRPFNAATRAEGGLPQPRTLAGAIRTALLSARGFNFRAFAGRIANGPDVKLAIKEDPSSVPDHLVDARFRGPWLARWDRVDAEADPLLSAPANLYRVKGSHQVRRAVESPGSTTGWAMITQTVTYDRDQIFRADPLPDGVDLPGWCLDPNGRRPLWRHERGKPERVEGFVTLEGILAFLKGGVPQVDRDHLVAACDLYAFDHRVGVAIEADSLTAADSQLFATRLLSLCKDVGFYAEMSWPAGLRGELEAALSSPFPWGGEGRHARAQLLSRPVRWPEVVPAPGAPAVYLLATAGVFKPPGPSQPLEPDALRDAGARIVASSSTGPIAVSGWDVARKEPRPTRFAAPPGTVYFAKNSNFPGRSSLCGESELVAEGWGFALRGVIADDH